MKICLLCHGNIARSQILHHFLADHARKASLSLDLFSCGSAPVDAYPHAGRLLEEVKRELRRRGLNGTVERHVLDAETLQHLVDSDLILAADRERRQDLLSRFGDRIPAGKVMLFYEFIGEGRHDFTDTYDPETGAQDPERFAGCFDELERIAEKVIDRISRTA
ncbi:MAG: hypothetical protein R3F07_12370 [Opitutaceae bacterium]